MVKRNRKKEITAKLAVLFAFINAAASLGFGCSYMSYPNPPEEYIVSRTKTIFVGTLRQKTFRNHKDDGTMYRIHSLVFRVDQGLKGQDKGTYLIEYWEKMSRQSSCDDSPPDPKVGEQWVVVDGYDEGTDVRRYVRDPRFLSWRFNPTEDRSQTSINRIRSAVASPRSDYFGEVEMAMVDDPPSDDHRIEIELRSSDGNSVIQAAKLEKGRFSFLDLRPGNYVIRLFSSKQEKFVTPDELTMKKSVDGTTFFADFKVSILPKRPEFENFTLIR